jgi:hypothetical protein
VVELKIGRFQPEYAGQLGFYVSWVDANLRRPDRHSPTVELLLCAGRNDNVVRCALAGATAPLAVADYTYDSLPAEVRELVPTDEQLDTALAATFTATAALDAGTAAAGGARLIGPSAPPAEHGPSGSPSPASLERAASTEPGHFNS